MSLGRFGADGFGDSPYGSALPPFGLESAIPLSSTLIRVRYTGLFDPSFLVLLSPSNYTIAPPVGVLGVILESAQTVLLITNNLGTGSYSLTINQGKGYFGEPLDPSKKTVNFSTVGTGTTSFIAVATGPRRVRLIFERPMLQNAALIDPSQYQILRLDSSTANTVISVAPEQISNVISVVLTLGSDLTSEQLYAFVDSGVLDENHGSIFPNRALFHYVRTLLRTSIPIKDFSGEASGGLLGTHNGLVFFSPALITSTPNSSIQVDEVDVCVRAYDEYQIPKPIDPPTFRTYKSGLGQTPLNSGFVLYAKFPILIDAQVELNFDNLADTVASPTDELVDMTLTALPAGRSLLNNKSWRLAAPSRNTSGSSAQVATSTPGKMLVTGLVGMTALDVGEFLSMSGSSEEGNNGIFLITSLISPTSVEIANPFGVTDSTNLTWGRPLPFKTAI